MEHPGHTDEHPAPPHRARRALKPFAAGIVVAALALGAVIATWLARTPDSPPPALRADDRATADTRGAEAALGAVRRAWLSELERVRELARGLAVNDDTYEFVRRPNFPYVDTYFAPERLVSLGVDTVLVLDAARRPIFWRRPNDPANEGFPDAERFLAAMPAFTTGPGSVRRGEPVLEGAVRFRRGTTLATVIPVMPRSGPATVRGYLVLGRTLDGAPARRIAESAAVPVDVLAPDDSQLDSRARQRLALARGLAPVVIVDPEYVRGFLPLHDVLGQIERVYAVSLPRAMHLVRDAAPSARRESPWPLLAGATLLLLLVGGGALWWAYSPARAGRRRDDRSNIERLAEALAREAQAHAVPPVAHQRAAEALVRLGATADEPPPPPWLAALATAQPLGRDDVSESEDARGTARREGSEPSRSGQMHPVDEIVADGGVGELDERVAVGGAGDVADVHEIDADDVLDDVVVQSANGVEQSYDHVREDVLGAEPHSDFDFGVDAEAEAAADVGTDVEMNSAADAGVDVESASVTTPPGSADFAPAPAPATSEPPAAAVRATPTPALRHAQLVGGLVEAGRVAVHYQPQISAVSGAVVGVEALLRWQDENAVLRSAAELFDEHGPEPFAAATEFVLRRACADRRHWLAQVGRTLPVSVNVGLGELRDPAFLERVSRVLEESDLAPAYLELEVPEAALAHAGSVESAALDRAYRLGLGIAIGGFVAADAPLRAIANLPVAKLKIDSSLVAELPHDEHSRTVVDAILAVGRTLGVAVCAEGVETLEQAEYLEHRHCPLVQGWHYGRPMDADRFLELLKGSGVDTLRLPLMDMEELESHARAAGLA